MTWSQLPCIAQDLVCSHPSIKFKVLKWRSKQLDTMHTNALEVEQPRPLCFYPTVSLTFIKFVCRVDHWANRHFATGSLSNFESTIGALLAVPRHRLSIRQAWIGRRRELVGSHFLFLFIFLLLTSILTFGCVRDTVVSQSRHGQCQYQKARRQFDCRFRGVKHHRRSSQRPRGSWLARSFPAFTPCHGSFRKSDTAIGKWGKARLSQHRY